jgi:hypothetical protein
VPRFDVYAHPSPRASHARLLDVQSDLVSTSTRWCVPLALAAPASLAITGAQFFVQAEGQRWLVDTPNILAVPAVWLRNRLGRLASDEQLQAGAALDFMLRGY